MDNIFSRILSNHQHKWQHSGLRVAAFSLMLIVSTTALAQSGKTDNMPLQFSPVPPYLIMVNGWLQAEVESARKAQVVNQKTLDDCRALLDKARSAQNATAVAAAQRAVNTADEGLRKEGSSSAKAAGFMPRIEGTVEIQPAGGGAAHPITDDTPPVLGPGDTLRTGKDGHVDVLLSEGGFFSLDAGSALILAEKGADALYYGEVLYRLHRKFEVRIPAAVCAVRGTQFVVREIPGKPSSVVVIEGTVAFSDIKGAKTVLVGAGQQSYLLPDGMPAEPTKANLQEMKKWWEE